MNLNFCHPSVEKAAYFAIGAHGNQKRKYTGEPYWYHLCDVETILRKHAEVDVEMLQAAWLHDVVEDTSFTIFDIQEFFGPIVARYVSDLTEAYAPTRHARKAYYNEKLQQACPDVQTIKYADLISNTSSIVQHDPAFAKVYLAEKRELLSMIDRGDKVLYDMALRICYEAKIYPFEKVEKRNDNDN